MARRAGVVLTVVLLTGLVATPPALRSWAQTGGSPSASPVGSPALGLSLGPGITVKTLATGTADQLPGAGSLVLERITLPPGATTGMRQIPAPELVYAETGPLTAEDSLGLQSTLPTGAQAILATNAAYEVRNTGSTPVSFLRLRLAEATPAAASNPASTAVGTPAAKPTTTVLFQGQSASFPSGAGMLFLAQVTYAPGADTGQHAYAGPVGFAVVSGTLSISSPSGLTGQLPAGRGLVLPANTPDREQNQGGQPVVALLAGVVPVGQSLAQAITPTPTPTVPSTETPVPTDTPVPTATSIPSATSAATAAVTVDMEDIKFVPNEISIPANTNVQITLDNQGALPHNFSVTDHKNPGLKNLGISVTLQPGQSKTIMVNAPAGDYYFYCDEPGHEAAGMSGTLHVVGAAATTATTSAATNLRLAPFQVTIISVTQAKTVGEFMQSTAHGVYVVVALSVVNAGDKPVDLISSDVFEGATLRDNRGRTFSLDDSASISASQDSWSNLQPGLTYQIALAFDVPPDAAGFTLVIGGHDLPLAPVTPPPPTSSAGDVPARPQFTAGEPVTVTQDGVNMRDQPSTSGNVIETLDQNDQITMLSGPTQADGYSWYQVEDLNQQRGYVPGEFLSK